MVLYDLASHILEYAYDDIQRSPVTMGWGAVAAARSILGLTPEWTSIAGVDFSFMKVRMLDIYSREMAIRPSSVPEPMDGPKDSAEDWPKAEREISPRKVTNQSIFLS